MLLFIIFNKGLMDNCHICKESEHGKMNTIN